MSRIIYRYTVFPISTACILGTVDILFEQEDKLTVSHAQAVFTLLTVTDYIWVTDTVYSYFAVVE